MCSLTTESTFTGRVVNSIDMSKKNESKLSKPTVDESVKNDTAAKVIPVKLLSSKEKAIIMIDGKNVCIHFVIARVISLAVARLLMPIQMKVVVSILL